MLGPLLKVQMWFCVAGARDSAPCQKWAKREGLVAFPTTMAGAGHSKRGCILEHQIFSLGKMILRDRCSTPYDLASLFRGRRNTLDRWDGNIAKRIGTRLSALHSSLHSWRLSRTIASFLMLSTSKHEEVSQNCFVFDVVKFKNWGGLPDLLRFWCSQVQKLRKSRRIALFPTLTTHSITHSLTHLVSVTHSLTSLTHLVSVTHSLPHSLTHLIHFHSHHSLIHSHSLSLTSLTSLTHITHSFSLRCRRSIWCSARGRMYALASLGLRCFLRGRRSIWCSARGRMYALASLGLRCFLRGRRSIWCSARGRMKCEIQLIWESTDLKFNWFEFQLISDSIDLKVNFFETQLLWDSTDLRFNWFEIQLISTSIDLRFIWFENQLIWNLISDSSWKLENEAFLRDFLQKQSFEALKQSFSARFPSKTKLRSSKTKLFCQTSFKNKQSFSARLPSKMKLRNSKTKFFCETSFKNGTSGTNRVTSDHKGDTVTLCDRRGTPSTCGHNLISKSDSRVSLEPLMFGKTTLCFWSTQRRFRASGFSPTIAIASCQQMTEDMLNLHGHHPSPLADIVRNDQFLKTPDFWATALSQTGVSIANRHFKCRIDCLDRLFYCKTHRHSATAMGRYREGPEFFEAGPPS